MFGLRKRLLLRICAAAACIILFLYVGHKWVDNANSLHGGAKEIENVHAAGNFLPLSTGIGDKAYNSPFLEFLVRCRRKNASINLHLLQESIVRQLQNDDLPLTGKDLLLGGAASHWTIRQKDLEPFVDVVLESMDILSEMTGDDVSDREKRKELKGNCGKEVF